ncbi:hypothetical protein T459_30928 [Capsicum annuum]|uniref:Uncharacterized protein n=1 Tax=Capsicum annuum TaxID=4072 RepID=A0A2G2Y9T0_CAPAN|nr:hypothetical protein T459_30928 [Capsicum annuum]
MFCMRLSSYGQRNCILSGLQDDLYNVYSRMKTSKELLNSLEQIYKTEDAGTKKFFVARFLEYKIIDSLVVNEAFQISAIIEKLLPLWKDFKNYLKHKRKEMTVKDLIVKLHIKEDNIAVERRSKGNSIMNGVNFVEDDPNNSKKRKKAR